MILMWSTGHIVNCSRNPLSTCFKLILKLDFSAQFIFPQLKTWWMQKPIIHLYKIGFIKGLGFCPWHACTRRNKKLIWPVLWHCIKMNTRVWTGYRVTTKGGRRPKILIALRLEIWNGECFIIPRKWSYQSWIPHAQSRFEGAVDILLLIKFSRIWDMHHKENNKTSQPKLDKLKILLYSSAEATFLIYRKTLPYNYLLTSKIDVCEF